MARLSQDDRGLVRLRESEGKRRLGLMHAYDASRTRQQNATTLDIVASAKSAVPHRLHGNSLRLLT